MIAERSFQHIEHLVRSSRSSVPVLLAAILLLMVGAPPSYCQHTDPAAAIVRAPDADYEERLAANQIQRYIYLRTGNLFEIREQKQLPAEGNLIVVAGQQSALLEPYLGPILAAEGVSRLQEQELLVSTVEDRGRKLLLVSGGDPTGVLYGAYRLAEHLGVEFYLHGDVLPQQKMEWKFPELGLVSAPLFNLRGILPFHDFPEGPDWWDQDAYKAILSQLAKLKMNFIGLHTYPQRPELTYDEDIMPKGWDAEPTVWIGRPEDVNEDSSVEYGYPASYANTMRHGDWGYIKKPTGNYLFGASQLFETDAYGPDVMEGYMPHATDQEGFQTLFNRTGNLLEEAFTWAQRHGIKTTVGTETPLTLPKRVEELFSQHGLQPGDSTTVRKAYEGMFRWVKQNYPLDYYWFWTPEDWTWEGTTPEEVEQTLRDLRQAMQAAENMDAPFTLATAGWVLGPTYDRTLFDKILPNDMPVSAINRQFGITPIDTSFADVTGRPTWVIPWLEDDPAMIQPQLWTGRIRRDAAQALAYDATALIGLHWRTKTVGPMVSQLAQAGWSQQGWNPDYPAEVKVNEARDDLTPDSLADKYYNILPSEDFYRDWAETHFGKPAADNIANLFADNDSFAPFSYEYLNKQIPPTPLPRPTTWNWGPGGIRPDTSDWEQVKPQYAFVDRMAELRPLVDGVANRQRFDYWLNSFRYLRAIGKLNTIWGRYQQAVEQTKTIDDRAPQKQFAREQVLPVRIEIIDQLQLVYNYLLSTVSTMGDLGTVDNWERHIVPMLLERPGQELEQLLGGSLTAEAVPSREYTGAPRLFVPVVRTNLDKGEQLRINAIVLASLPPNEVSLFWRPLADTEFRQVEADHLARGVYSIALPQQVAGQSFEYYIQADISEHDPLNFPVTAPETNQTVVVTEIE